MRSDAHVTVWTSVFSVLLLAMPAAAQDLAEPLAALRAVGPNGQGNAAAAAAWKQVVQSDAAALPEVAAAIDGANPLAANWIRGAFEAIAERQLAGGGKLPVSALEKFVLDKSHDPRGRRLTFEWLEKADPTARDRLIPDMLHDPSVELRRDAVARLIRESTLASDKQQATDLLKQAFDAAVDDDQVKELKKSLADRGVEVDLARHYGYVLRWKVIGTFDNKDQKGYAVAYPPEKGIDLAASYPSTLPNKKATWVEMTTDDEYGLLDLNKKIGEHQGVIVYCLATFMADQARDVEIRYSTRNASKLWLNGKLLTEHEVYHAGRGMDQYTGRGTLKKGANTILVKLCQNEQEQSWAKSWEIQLRVCDSTGTAVLSTDRPVAGD